MNASNFRSAGRLVALATMFGLTGCGDTAPSTAAPAADPTATRAGTGASHSTANGPARVEQAATQPSAATSTARPDDESTAPTADVPTTDVPANATAAKDGVQIVYRPDDERPIHDDEILQRAGIGRYASKRLVLYTDIPADAAASLPGLVDDLYEALVDYFGPLPPARDGAEFQMTGYVMADPSRFEATGLLPDDLPPFHHGRHRGRRFWMREQDYDYYRSHLLLHEATHCFMTLLPGSIGPDWYMEGMAERFGTHRLGDNGVAFGVMPTSPEGVAGWGRLTLVRQNIADGGFRTLDDVFGMRPEVYLDNEGYAWAWAACHFLDTHPRYRDRFRELGDPALRRRLGAEFLQRFAGEAPDLNCEWALFAHTLRYGYDLDAAAIEFPHARSLSSDGARVTVAADRGWQSSGIRLPAGSRCRVTAEGRFTLADDPRPWTSDAGGISYDYFDGRPIGRLLAAVLYNDRATGPDAAGGLLSPIDIGREATIDAPAEGVLFFRLNDHWDRLDDNEGAITVTIRHDAG